MIDTTGKKSSSFNLLNLRSKQPLKPRNFGKSPTFTLPKGFLKLEYLTQDILGNILSHLDGNSTLENLGRVNRRFYADIIPGHFKSADNLNLQIPKVEQIKKESKTIDDLLNWNREVKFILGQSQSLLELDFNCHDFKIFNPLNEKLISSGSFPRLRKYSVGIFDEGKFP